MKTKQYIKLPQISNQKIRQKYYTPGSVTHPAKADIPMMIWILEKFVQDGDIVLDPMAGIFTTGIEGMRLFPNSLFIGVDLEDKFVKMARANIKKVERIAKKDMFMKIGKSTAVQGDARELEKVLREKVSKIITSPPFFSTKQEKFPLNRREHDKGFKWHKKLSAEHKGVDTVFTDDPNNIENSPKYGEIDKIISSPPFQQAGTDTEKRMKKRLDEVFKGRSYVPTQKYRDKKNISNIKPYGQVNKIIASPPFGGKVQHKTNYLGKQKRESGFEYSDNPENIGNMPHGQIDKVITSPPYSEIRMDGGGKDRAGMKPYTDEPADTWRTQRDQKNIGNLPHGKIDKVISSPPYEEGIGHGRGRNKELTRSKKIYIKGRDSYSKGKTNIGSLTGKTYLGEMLRVYQECYRVLKPAGLMILITKDFIRNKKRVRLGEDTIKLCQIAGFTFKEIYYRKIEHPSFWRTLYHQKHPEVEKIDSEDILVFQKRLKNES